MKKLWRGLKKRYFDGVLCMRIGGGLPSMMYLAVCIIEFFILCKVTPENTMQYAKIFGVNFVWMYLYSSIIVKRFMLKRLNQNSTVMWLERFGFAAIGLFIGLIIARSLKPLLLLVVFAIPIIVAIGMIYVEENCALFEDFIELKKIGNFGTVVLTTLIPVIAIMIPLIFMRFSIWYIIVIVPGFLLIAPLVCWAEREEYGILGAMRIEW
ncbi:unknown [Clostridium sp. CAG:575]|nr:unknown [Clostridium sp. CAG:575]